MFCYRGIDGFFYFDINYLLSLRLEIFGFRYDLTIKHILTFRQIFATINTIKGDSK